MDLSPQALRQRYTFSDFLFYIGLLAVPVLTALLGIGSRSRWGLLLYILLAGLAVVLVMKFYCSRCPHYTREDKLLRCIFFWNLPKPFAPRPGDLNATDKLVAWVSPAVVSAFPLYWLYREPMLLLIYIVSGSVFAAAVRRHECHRCIYFACPMNKVPQARKAGQSLS
ncbi:MAG: hypothetical protein P8010_14755 [Desulfosarcinaceae bacterium]